MTENPGPILLNCPSCNHKLQLSPKYVGVKGACNNCSQSIIGVEISPENYTIIAVNEEVLTEKATTSNHLPSNQLFSEPSVDPAPIQATPIQAAPIQAAPIQAAPIQAAPIQAAPTQAAPPQATPPQAAPTQAAPTQAAPPQAAPTQAAPEQVVSNNVADSANTPFTHQKPTNNSFAQQAAKAGNPVAETNDATQSESETIAPRSFLDDEKKEDKEESPLSSLNSGNMGTVSHANVVPGKLKKTTTAKPSLGAPVITALFVAAIVGASSIGLMFTPPKTKKLMQSQVASWLEPGRVTIEKLPFGLNKKVVKFIDSSLPQPIQLPTPKEPQSE